MDRSTRALWLWLAALTIAAMGVGYLLIRRASADLIAEGRRSFDEGKILGQSLDADGCVRTLYARPVPSESMRHELDEEVFLEGCMTTSTPTHLCDTIPSSTGIKDVMRFAAWKLAQCHLHGRQDRVCISGLNAVGHYCGRRANQTGQH
jgi:hypothetical protein